MRIRYVVTGTATLVVSFLTTDAFCQAPSSPAASRSGMAEHRLFIRFVEDAAIVPSFWLEGQARFQSDLPALDSTIAGASDANLLSVGPVFALNVAEDFEFGGRISLAFRDPEGASSDTGLTDLDLWGKFSVVSDPVQVALGLALTVPTGDEDKFLGSGETNVEFFAGIRKDFTRLTLAGNAGVRINQDPEFDNIELEGKNSLLLGAAVLVPVGDKVALIAECSLETERIEGQKNDSRLLGGFEYMLDQNFMFRGAAGAGLAQGAPNFELLGSAVWLF